MEWVEHFALTGGPRGSMVLNSSTAAREGLAGDSGGKF